MTDPKDTYTSFGAGLLAKTIETYWHDRGARHVKVERYELEHFPGMWGVRSNLVAGMPPKAKENLLRGVVVA